MKDQEIQILEQYDINVNSTRKIRGAVLCDTKQGFMLLKKLDTSPKRVPILFRLYEHLKENGYEYVDQIVKNKEQELISSAEDGDKYILKQWYSGRECNIRHEAEVLKAVRNLACIHKVLRDVDFSQEELVLQGEDLRNVYLRHNREMKKVRSFVRNRVEKNDFEFLFLKYFEPMYDLAKSTEKALEDSGYDALLKNSRERNMYTHGDYNYHNLIIEGEHIATTNFEHFHEDVQVSDLYYFMRKTLEKNQWSVVLGNRMLDAYNEVLPMKREELEYLALRISYPEKFWKVANSYYRSGKVWIPMKNLEKLELAVKQIEVQKQFLEKIFSFHL